MKSGIRGVPPMNTEYYKTFTSAGIRSAASRRSDPKCNAARFKQIPFIVASCSTENKTTPLLAAPFGRSNFFTTHSGGYELYYPLEYNAVQSVQSQLTFRSDILPVSSGQK
jgi:hypothetical protein